MITAQTRPFGDLDEPHYTNVQSLTKEHAIQYLKQLIMGAINQRNEYELILLKDGYDEFLKFKEHWVRASNSIVRYAAVLEQVMGED